MRELNTIVSADSAGQYTLSFDDSEEEFQTDKTSNIENDDSKLKGLPTPKGKHIKFTSPQGNENSAPSTIRWG